MEFPQDQNNWGWKLYYKYRKFFKADVCIIFYQIYLNFVLADYIKSRQKFDTLRSNIKFLFKKKIVV